MNVLKFLSAALLLAILAACNVAPQTPQTGAEPASPVIRLDPDRAFIENQLIVGYSGSTRPDDIAANLGAVIEKDWSKLKAALITLPKDLSATKAQALLKKVPGVAYTHLNYVIEHEPVPQDGINTTGISPQQVIVSDPEFSRQWQHRQLNSEAAWALGATGKGIRIGVHDDFIDHRHPDLVGNILYPGYDGFNDSLITETTPHDGIGDHGTAVAGKAAAASNTLGGRGVAYEASIVPLSISEPTSGNLTLSGIVNAAVFAADGPDGNSPLFGPGPDTDSAPGRTAYVDIVNMSWGSNGYDQIVKDVMDYMLLHGIVLVTSAGNTPILSFQEPAWHPGLITVAATDPQDRRTAFSNRGLHLNVAAPGERTWTTATRACLLTGAADGSDCTGTEVDYGYFGGTSSASPAVAGVAALILDAAATRDVNGDITGFTVSPAQVRRLLEQTAYQPVGTAFNDDLGYGIVDAGAAVQEVLSGNLPADGASLAVFSQVTDGTYLPGVGLSLVPMDADGPIKYTQTTDGGLLEFIDEAVEDPDFDQIMFAEGAGFFLNMDPGYYLLQASGPHEATTGASADVYARPVNLTPDNEFVFGLDELASVKLDVELFTDPFEGLTSVQVAVGSTIRASLAESGDEDVYTVLVAAGKEYWLNIESLSGTADTILEVYADAALTQLLASNDNNRDVGRDSALAFTADTSGEAFVRVREAQGLGSKFNVYELDLSELVGAEAEPNGSGVSSAGTISSPNFAGADLLAVGQSIRATIDPSGEVDFFEVTLEPDPAATYIVDLETATNSSPDTVAVIFDSNGAVLASNDDADAQDSRVSFSLDSTPGQPVTFYVGVTDYVTSTQGSTGPYTLSITSYKDPAIQ